MTKVVYLPPILLRKGLIEDSKSFLLRLLLFFFLQNTNCKVCSGYIGVQLFSRLYVFGVFLNFFIYYLFIIFIFGCVGSSFLCEGFL